VAEKTLNGKKFALKTQKRSYIRYWRDFTMLRFREKREFKQVIAIWQLTNVKFALINSFNKIDKNF